MVLNQELDCSRSTFSSRRNVSSDSFLTLLSMLHEMWRVYPGLVGQVIRACRLRQKCPSVGTANGTYISGRWLLRAAAR